MPSKLHFLCSHLDVFQEDFGNFSEEHDERFYQDIELTKRHKAGRTVQ